MLMVAYMLKFYFPIFESFCLLPRSKNEKQEQKVNTFEPFYALWKWKSILALPSLLFISFHLLHSSTPLTVSWK